MKLITYSTDDRGPRLGAVVDDSVVDLADASDGAIPADMRAFLEMGALGLAAARQAVGPAASGPALGSVKIHAPISNPTKIVAIGLNYMDHVLESGARVPKFATTFSKFPSSIIGPR